MKHELGKLADDDMLLNPVWIQMKQMESMENEMSDSAVGEFEGGDQEEEVMVTVIVAMRMMMAMEMEMEMAMERAPHSLST